MYGKRRRKVSIVHSAKFSYPGLNNLYYRYHCHKAKSEANQSTLSGLQELMKEEKRCYFISNIRMVAVFLGYLLPFLVAFILLLTNVANILVPVVIYEIVFFVANFALDQRYRRVVGSDLYSLPK